MKIGIVAYEMEGSKTGVGRYLEGLLTGLAECGRPWEWHLFFKGDSFEHPLWRDERFIPRFDGRPAARPILWEQFRLPGLLRHANLDFVFSPAYSLPCIPGMPNVRATSMLTVHDLSFERLPEEFSWKERWRRRWLARRSARMANRVLADTTEIARELERTYALSPNKIGVVPIGIDAGFRNTAGASSSLLEPYGIEPPYLLYLGSILARRHIDLMIEAFAEVADDFPELKLVLAGQNRLRQPDDLKRWIASSGRADRILEVGYVTEDALGALYHHAELSYYLSSYEGYGLPPLESLAAGTPTLVGRGLALDDLWPDYPYRALLLDRQTVSALTRRALEDEDERRRIGEEGQLRMARLDWKHSAELFLTEIERAMAS